PFFDATFTMKPVELWRASVIGSLRRLWPLLLVSAITTPIALFLIGPTADHIFVASLFWVMIAALVLLRPLYALSSKKTRDRLATPTQMTIDSQSIKLYIDGDLRSNLKIADMLKATRVREFWILGVMRNFNYAIPTRVFSPEQDARFAEVLRAHKL